MKITIRHVAVVGSAALLLCIVWAVPALGHDDAARESPNNENAEGVRLRYAQANLHLAEIELQIALTENEKIPNLYPARTIRRLRNNVAYAQETLRYETDRNDDRLHKLHLTDLEGALRYAESDLAAAVAANKRVPGAVNDLEVKRLRAAAEVARLAVEKAREPAVTQSPMDHLQWQLDRIRSELTRLYVRMDKAESHN